ncbi:MAG: type II toxin-antitoxin system Phd/YefM family antitoxin [Bacilli bacterium]|nr:type II toxin-antitoxin system Phd/YefM family antitoxin [Bacilli bacterium]
MLAVNYSTLRNSLKSYCDHATDSEEVVVVTRKDEKNVVLMSLNQYNEMLKQINNSQYLKLLQKAIEQIKNGDVVIKHLNDLD